jgi:SAM-dependent methyltransferase
MNRGEEKFGEVLERIESPGALAQNEVGDHLARYLYATNFATGRRVLDAGTGLGYGAALLRESGAREVVAVDIDERTVEKARANYRQEGLIFLVDDCETFSKVQGPFDVICSFENIEHLRNADRFVESASRLLADDGVLLCSSPDRASTNSVWEDGKPTNPFHVCEWYRDEFRGLLSRGFEEIDLRSQVISLTALLRLQAVANLHRALRPSRVLGKLLVGRGPDSFDVSGLAAMSSLDYPIVPHSIAAAMGKPWSHYALCRRPRR